jgi:cellulose synthase/poly-beta-1,6-N-acetylglucosamine synthase-like glycosyltransferase
VQTTIITVFAVSCGLILYAYCGYALLIWVFARLFSRNAVPPADGDLPSVSVLIAAYNEASVIDGRIENALALDYPSELLEIMVASDGSSDGTAEIVRRYAERGVRVADYPQRRGKASVLNAAMQEVQGRIAILSDANTYFDPMAARRLVRWFADRKVGAVCGKLVLLDPQTGRNVDSMYWKYETFLKKCEGRLGALLGANGAIYAIRRESFVPIPGDTIVDDFVIPLLARLRSGRSIIYDPEAVAWEETPANISSEFRRRSRIGAGGFQSIALLWRLLSPRQGWIAFTFFSHKVLRWLCPFFLIVAFVANCLLVRQPLFQVTLAAQALFYLISLAGAYLPGSGLALRLVRLTTMFSSMNLALLVGFWRWISGRQRGIWQRTAR